MRWRICAVSMPNARPTANAASANLRVRKTYGADRIQLSALWVLRRKEFSERKGTALFNCKIGEAQAVVGDGPHLDSACGLNATARLVPGCLKEAVGRHATRERTGQLSTA